MKNIKNLALQMAIMASRRFDQRSTPEQYTADATAAEQVQASGYRMLYSRHNKLGKLPSGVALARRLSKRRRNIAKHGGK